uniref:Uncharacterized protein n=1 Tax=Arundo donax TaxID=35708 RepID=A0A0A9ERS5_ARUDO
MNHVKSGSSASSSVSISKNVVNCFCESVLQIGFAKVNGFCTAKLLQIDYYSQEYRRAT